MDFQKLYGKNSDSCQSVICLVGNPSIADFSSLGKTPLQRVEFLQLLRGTHLLRAIVLRDLVG